MRQGHRLAWGVIVGLACGGCGDAAGPAGGSETGMESTGSSGSSGPPVTPPDPVTSTTGPDPAGTSSSGGADQTTAATDTGPVDCPHNVVLMGYWPPTNEMLRPWSPDPAQNPGAWIGPDWEGYGYDVYAFFPEFPPDGDPSNDSIGDDGAVGSPRFDLRVDYQATSEDFWRLVDTYQPNILVTTSRGGGIGWEIEAIEGGHGGGNPGDPAYDWSSDQHGAEHFPTQATVEPRTWDAITTYRQGNTLATQLPAQAIFDAAQALGVASVEIDQTGTSGNFLSGFLGLHGLTYSALAPHNVAAGHIHVANGLPVATASQLIEQTLHVVLQAHPVEQATCPQ